MDIKIINEKEIFKKENRINVKNQIIKRNYGIDLLRIISMINIINLHLNLASRLLTLNYTSPKFASAWHLETFSFHAVNSFGLISGVVGYKRYKFSNLIFYGFKYFFILQLFQYIFL